MNTRYAYEKLWIAMETLLKTNDDSVKAICDAYISFHTLRAEDFPPNLRLKWVKLKEELTAHTPADSQSNGLRKSLERKTESDRQNIITDIIELYIEVKKLNST